MKIILLSLFLLFFTGCSISNMKVDMEKTLDKTGNTIKKEWKLTKDLVVRNYKCQEIEYKVGKIKRIYKEEKDKSKRLNHLMSMKEYDIKVQLYCRDTVIYDKWEKDIKKYKEDYYKNTPFKYRINNEWR